MSANSTDYFTEVGNPGSATTLAAPGHAIAGTSFTVVSTSNWPTNTGVIFAVDNYTLQTVNGVPNTAVRTPGTYTEWEGVVASATSITGAVLRYGTDQNYSAGSLTRVYIPVASSRENRLAQGIQVQHKQDGTHTGVTTDTLVTSGNVTIGGTLTIGGSATAAGWSPITGTVSAAVNNGNRSYSLTTSNDNTALISPGMRLMTTRTVLAPPQCTSLNGTTQYYSKASPAGMTFTDDFVAGAWVKLSSYPTAAAGVITMFNGTSGWQFTIETTGQVQLAGFNGAAGNNSVVKSYQSIPLNKWVHITAQLDMSTFTATTTTSYVMIDGVDVPASVTRAGTNPTTLVQAGTLVVGAAQGGANGFFPGKIAQAAVFNAKVTQATMRTYMSQGLLGTETSLISAYSFSNSINDLNTTNTNNLTANGSAVATTADSPFGNQANGTISSTLDYAIVTAVTSSTITCQVPEGCTIATSGGISAVSYSTQKSPFGFPGQRTKWQVNWLLKSVTSMVATTNIWSSGLTNGTLAIPIPLGEWSTTYEIEQYIDRGAGTQLTGYTSLSTSNSSESDSNNTSAAKVGTGSTTTYLLARHVKTIQLSLSAFTTYYIIARAVSGDAGGMSHSVAADSVTGATATVVTNELAYL